MADIWHFQNWNWNYLNIFLDQNFLINHSKHSKHLFIYVQIIFLNRITKYILLTCKNEDIYLFIERILLRYLMYSCNHRRYFYYWDYYRCFWCYIIIVTIVSVRIASCSVLIPFYASGEVLGSSIAAASESCQSRRDRAALLEGQISDLRSTDAIWMRRSMTPRLNATRSLSTKDNVQLVRLFR